MGSTLHIDDCLLDWLSFSRERSLTVVNPGIMKCPDKFNHLNHQVVCNNKGASNYFLDLSNDKSTLTQKMVRKIRNKIRKKVMVNLTK